MIVFAGWVVDGGLFPMRYIFLVATAPAARCAFAKNVVTDLGGAV